MESKPLLPGNQPTEYHGLRDTVQWFARCRDLRGLILFLEVPVRTLPRNIVVCCDGTDNEVATDSTNVLRLFRMLERDGRQVAYYDGGVGTLVDPAAISRVRKSLSRRLDAAIGLRVRENVIAAYRFLAQSYQPGDKIYL